VILNQYRKGKIDIVGIAEPDKKLWDKYSKLYKIPKTLFFADLKNVVAAEKPNAVLAYNAVAKHIDVVEICAPLRHSCNG
jgi:predicted dehydrogenase